MTVGSYDQREVGSAAPDYEELLALEAELRAALRAVRLVTEIGISADRHREFYRAALRLTRTGAGTPKKLRAKFPATFVTYIVAEGIYSYEGGEFWPSVIEPLRPRPGRDTGYEFRAALRGLGLSDFQDVVAEERGLINITPILAHGGIPKSCLEPFLRLIIQELSRGGGDAEELLARWRTARTKLHGLHAPAQRFLLYGGEPAIDLVDRTIDMIEESATGGRTVGGDEVGLPQYVVDAFRRLPPDDARPRRTSRTNVPRPTLVLDPYDGLGPTIRLPAVPTTLAGGTWRVDDGASSRAHQASAIASTTVRVGPARSYDVAFEAPGADRRWSFEGLDRFPCLVFDPDTGQALRDPALVRLESAWVLAPTEVTLSGAGTSLREVEELPAPSGAWTGFRVGHFNLEQATAIEVARMSDPGRVQRLVVVQPGERARLLGDEVDGVFTSDGHAVYADFPSLELPRGIDPERWRISVGGGDTTVDLSATAATAESPETASAVDLSAAFSGATLGVFRVRVRGPLGSDLHARFAVVPGLDIRRPTRVLLPDDDEPAVTTGAPRLSVDGSPPGERVTLDLERGADAVRFTVGEEDATVLTLLAHVPRLLWAVTHETKPALRPDNERLTVGAEEFEDELADVLTVRTGRPGTELELRLFSQRGIVQEGITAVAGGADGRWSFDLAHFADTIRLSQEARLFLRLTVDGVSVDVAEIVSRIGVSELRAESRFAGEFASVHVSWQQPRAIRSRVVRLWPVSRPWAQPITATVEDQRNDVEFSGYDLVAPGHYRAEVAIDDPWVAPPRPHTGDANTGLIAIGTRDQQADWIESLGVADPEALLTRIAAGFPIDTGMQLPPLQPVAHEAIVTAAALLEEIQPGASSTPSFARLRAALCEERETVFAGVAAAAAVDNIERSVLQRLSLRFARRVRTADGEVAQRDLEAAWRVVPLLAAVVDLGETEDNAFAAARCERFLGWTPGSPQPIPEGGRVTMAEAGRTAQELETARRFLGLLPQRALDPEALQLANFEWLIAQKHFEESPGDDEAPAPWWQTNCALAETLDAVDVDDETAQAIQSHLEARMPPRGTFPWAELPRITLAAALHAMAESPVGADARDALERALLFAPRLIEHDLLLAAVLTRKCGRTTVPC